MRQLLARFIHDRRGAVALMFAATLLPLVMLIGLSIDYSFYVQARSQFGMTADATALYSLREATAIYAIENKSGGSTPTPAQGGDQAGVAWFSAQLGTLPTATNVSGSNLVNVGPLPNSECPNATSCPAGDFQSVVTYTGSYPPFFNRLFKQSSNWSITGTATAATMFNYLELLVLMDDSASMLVSADPGNTSNTCDTTGTSNPCGTSDNEPIGTIESDGTADPGTVATMDLNTVCIPSNWIDNADGNTNLLTDNALSSMYYDPASFVHWANVQNLTSIPTFTAPATFNHQPACKNSGSFISSPSTTATSSSTTTVGPTTPCAFACHTAPVTSYHTLKAGDGIGTDPAPLYTYVNQLLTQETNGNYEYPDDLYGVARQLGVALKIDTVFQSLETMITTMSNSAQIPQQFAVGVYAFNSDACPIVNGYTDGSYALGEATTDLSGALSAVEADDYTLHPSSSTSIGETSFPPAINSTTPYNGDTNFPLSVSNLIYGTMTKPSASASTINSQDITPCVPNKPNGTAATTIEGTGTSAGLATPSATSTVGSVSTNPQKDIFIITDGLEDAAYISGGTPSATNSAGKCTANYRELGEMTGVTAEENKVTTVGCGTIAVCQQLKNLGFTVYVLFIPYPNTQHKYYYTNLEGSSGAAGMGEDPYTATDTGTTVNSSSSTETVNYWNNGSGTGTSPDTQALTACASTTGGHSDFYTAYSSADITTEMTQMLSSALNSAIRITN